MDAFIDLLKGEIGATINGLIGLEPEVDLKEVEDLNADSNIIPPMTKMEISVSGDFDANVLVLVPPQLATALSDMMLGGEGESRDDMEEDDIDAIKEVVSNIMGSISNSLNSQNEIPKLNFSVTEALFISDDEIALDGFSKMAIYDFKINSIENIIMFAFDHDFTNNIEGGSSVEEEDVGGGAIDTPTPSGGGGGAPMIAPDSQMGEAGLNAEEIKNISLLMDVKLTLRVRIGQKKMLLRDVIGMDIGSIVELDQLANEPLDILVDNKKIAEGEVVIVDGNFGIQITSIGTKKERLQQLKG